MLGDLATAVDELDIPVGGDDIATLFSLIDRMSAKATMALAGYDRDQAWKADGAASLPGWLRQFTSMTASSSYVTASKAKKLARLPVTAAAWLEGSLSGGQVDVICAHLCDRTLGLFAEHEAELVPTLVPLDVRQTATAMRLWQERADAVLDPERREERPNQLFHSQTTGGRFETKGSFDPMAGAIIDQACRRVMTTDGPDPEAGGRPWSERRAEALTDICQWFLAFDHEHNRGRNRPHLNLVITHDDLLDGRMPGQLLGYGYTEAASIHAVLCDCSLNRTIVKGRSIILDYGTSTDTVPDALFQAVAVRDEHCRHPGCDRPSWMCDAHHVIPVEQGGPTVISNLALYCRRHHTTVHKPGWRLRLDADGTLHLTDPAGRQWATHPGGLGVADDVRQVVAARGSPLFDAA